ncbi:hypothetical protein F5884DRAFT_745204 [Xylogone sp. PMI_703]|nr:hypothetical protein F5884DRAFT_745204 [Xylogone sp. PMI_703]
MAATTGDKPFLSGKKIIISGAGIAGSSFAVALRKLWPSQFPAPSITIYERDSETIDPSREGYTISIRSDKRSGGMQVLQKLGLLDSILDSSVTGIQEDPGTFNIWNINWHSIMRAEPTTPKGLPTPHMRVARNILRRRLIEAIPDQDQIQWEKIVVSAEKIDGGRVQVKLSNGEVDECDLLVVSDGARSKLRGIIHSDDTLNFTGVVSITGIAKFENVVPRPMDRDWGLVLGGMGTSLFVSPIDEHSAVWSITYQTSEPRETSRQPIPEAKIDELLQEALERGKAFKEPYQTLVKASDRATVLLLNYMDKEPLKHKVENLSTLPIVFIGDSNHAVTPFAGNGANMALMDGWDLAEQLIKAVSVESAIESFDRLCYPRAKSTLDFSHNNIRIGHAQGWSLYLYTLLFKTVNVLFRIRGVISW